MEKGTYLGGYVGEYTDKNTGEKKPYTRYCFEMDSSKDRAPSAETFPLHIEVYRPSGDFSDTLEVGKTYRLFVRRGTFGSSLSAAIECDCTNK